MRRLLVALAVGVLPAVVQAQNLLPNPNFAGDVTGWSPNANVSSFTWTGADGNPTVGSAQIVRSAGNAFIAPSSCIAVTGNTDYAFGAFIKNVDYAAMGNVLGFEIEWFSAVGCGGSSLRTDTKAGGNGNTINTWFELRCTTTGGTVGCLPLTSPATAASVAVRVGTYSIGTTARIDSVFFGPASCFPDPTAPVLTAPSAVTVRQTLCQ